jgi:hypothetical protein
MRWSPTVFLILAGCVSNPGPSPIRDAAMSFKSIGAACTADTPTTSECGYVPRFTCQTALPGGYCTASCNHDSDCPHGSICSGGLCKADCTAQSDCRDGYACLTMSASVSHPYCDLSQADAGVADRGA